MECIGKKYLVQGEVPKAETKKGIYIPVFGTNREFGSFIGTIIGHGTGYTKKEKKDLIPVGTKIIMDYNEKSQRTKLIMGEKNYYIIDPENILATIED